MKVFVAGATGAVGKQLVPMLVEHGHEVTGMTRTAAKAEAIRAMGGRPAVADALDPEAVAQAVARAEPDAVIHELTAIDLSSLARSIDKTFARTNRLRTEGTDHLLAAARAAGARRFVAQSFAGWPYERIGGPVKTEDDPLDDSPPKPVCRDAGSDPASRERGDGGRGDRGNRPSLRRLLRSRHLGHRRSARRAGRDDPEAPVPHRRRRRRESGRSSTSRTPRRPPRRRSSEGHRASTTSWTMIPRRSQSSCPSSPRRLAPSLRATSRAGSGVWSAARPR